MDREHLQAFLGTSDWQPTEENLRRAEAIQQRAVYESVDWLLSSMPVTYPPHNVGRLTKCFDTCVNIPGTKLTIPERGCMTACMDQWLDAQRTCHEALQNQPLRNALWAPFYTELQGLFEAGLDPELRVKQLAEMELSGQSRPF